jgi:hypothetical protein
MKNKKFIKNNKIVKHIFAVLFLSVLAISTPAQAFSWRQELGNIGKAVANVVVPIVTTAAAVFNKVLNLVTSCSDSRIDGIEAKCFDGGEQQVVQNGINVLKENKYRVNRNGELNPYTYFKQHTNLFLNWNSKQIRNTYGMGIAERVCSSGMAACHVNGITAITVAGLNSDKVFMAGLLLHESDHDAYAEHTCGDSADNNLSGPYGLEALYHMSRYTEVDSNLSVGEKALSYQYAIGRANYHLCGRADLRDQVLSYVAQETYNINYIPPQAVAITMPTPKPDPVYNIQPVNNFKPIIIAPLASQVLVPTKVAPSNVVTPQTQKIRVPSSVRKINTVHKSKSRSGVFGFFRKLFRF